MISLRSELRRKLLTFFYVNRAACVYVRRLAAPLQRSLSTVQIQPAKVRTRKG